jgi:hypothetical protein
MIKTNSMIFLANNDKAEQPFRTSKLSDVGKLCKIFVTEATGQIELKLVCRSIN